MLLLPTWNRQQNNHSQLCLISLSTFQMCAQACKHTRLSHSPLSHVAKISLLPSPRSLLLFYFISFRARDNCPMAIIYTLCLYHKYPKYHPAHFPPYHKGIVFLVSVMIITYRTFKQLTLLRKKQVHNCFLQKTKVFSS